MADRARLEELFGTIIRGHAYPYGKYSDTVVDILRKSGIVYARTTQSTEKFELPKEPLCWHPTCHHKNPKLMELLDTFLALEKARTPQVFYLWGHSYEFDGADNWNVIEELLDKVSGKEDIWYATNIEIIDYVRAADAVITSADNRTLINPTNTDLCFRVEGSGVKKPGTYELKAGQTIHID